MDQTSFVMRVPQEIIVSRISQAGITVMLTERLARWWTKSLHVLQTQGVSPSDLPSRNVKDHEGPVVVYLTGGAGGGGWGWGGRGSEDFWGRVTWLSGGIEVGGGNSRRQQNIKGEP